MSSAYESEPSDGLTFMDGLSAVFGGIGFVLKTPSSWPYAMVPACIATLLGCGLGFLGVWGAWGAASTWIDGQDGWSTTGRWLVTVSLAVVFWIMAIFIGLISAQPLSGWALERLSCQQEAALTGH